MLSFEIQSNMKKRRDFFYKLCIFCLFLFVYIFIYSLLITLL